jgi:hypothetical protein
MLRRGEHSVESLGHSSSMVFYHAHTGDYLCSGGANWMAPAGDVGTHTAEMAMEA